MKRTICVLLVACMVTIGFAGCNKSGNAIKTMQNMEITVNNSERFEIIKAAAGNSGNTDISKTMPSKEAMSLKEYLDTGFTNCDWSYSEDNQRGELVTFTGNLKDDNTYYFYIWNYDSKSKMYKKVALGDETGTISENPKNVERLYDFYWSYFYEKYGAKISDVKSFRKEQIAASAIVKMMGYAVW